MWAVIVEASGLDSSVAVVSASLAVTVAITRVMAVLGVGAWLRRCFMVLPSEPISRADFFEVDLSALG